MINKLKNLKKDFEKIKIIRKKINEIRNFDNLFGSLLGLIALPPFVFYSFYGILGFLIDNIEKAKSPDNIMAGFLSLLVSLFFLLFLCGVYDFSSRLYNKKNRKIINKIDSLILENISFENKKDISEILELNNGLSEESQDLEKIYFNKNKLKEEELNAELIFSYFEKETLTIEMINNYVDFANENLDEQKEKIISEILYDSIKNFSKEDFFEHKNELIDIVINNFNMEKQKGLSERIKNKIKFYNKKETDEKKTLKELMSLKNAVNESENININNDKKLVVKSI